MTSRRGFFGLAAAAAAFALDPERALWIPGARVVSIPARVRLPETMLIGVDFDRWYKPMNVWFLAEHTIKYGINEALRKAGKAHATFLPLSGGAGTEFAPLGSLPLVRTTHFVEPNSANGPFTRYDVLVKI